MIIFSTSHTCCNIPVQVYRSCSQSASIPNRRLFLSWKLIIDSAKAKRKASATAIKARKKWVLVGSGDVDCFGNEVRGGTISLIELASEDMTIKKPNPLTAKSRGAAKDIEDGIPSIVSTFTIDGNLCHKKVCAALLPYLTGWERIFVLEVAQIENIGAIRKAKLRAIAEAILENPPRLCRYCQGRVQIIDEYSYLCNKCGNCLNFNWNGGDQ